MLARAALLLAGTLLMLGACTPPGSAPRRATLPSPSAAGIDPAARRDQALRAARVWSEPPTPIRSANLAANPANGFRTDEDVACTFRLQTSGGFTPKFECALPSGEEIKVKYGHRAVEVFGEVAATRLLSALGFGADRMYVVRSVRCRGCPLFPYPRTPLLDAARRDMGREVTFTLAAIERKLPGRAIRGAQGGTLSIPPAGARPAPRSTRYGSWRRS
jgi:hypothetical protein